MILLVIQLTLTSRETELVTIISQLFDVYITVNRNRQTRLVYQKLSNVRSNTAMIKNV